MHYSATCTTNFLVLQLHESLHFGTDYCRLVLHWCSCMCIYYFSTWRDLQPQGRSFTDHGRKQFTVFHNPDSGVCIQVVWYQWLVCSCVVVMIRVAIVYKHWPNTREYITWTDELWKRWIRVQEWKCYGFWKSSWVIFPNRVNPFRKPEGVWVYPFLVRPFAERTTGSYINHGNCHGRQSCYYNRVLNTCPLYTHVTPIL